MLGGGFATRAIDWLVESGLNLRIIDQILWLKTILLEISVTSIRKLPELSSHIVNSSIYVQTQNEL
jgi:hypothetical protein